MVVFDYTGNAWRDEGEPPIEGVPIRVAGLSTTSGPDGCQSLAGVPAGGQGGAMRKLLAKALMDSPA
jgi:hypothetical protein